MFQNKEQCSKFMNYEWALNHNIWTPLSECGCDKGLLTPGIDSWRVELIDAPSLLHARLLPAMIE